MYEADSDANHRTQLAISDGAPQRRRGVAAPCDRSCADNDSVSIQPGATQFTVIPEIADVQPFRGSAPESQ